MLENYSKQEIYVSEINNFIIIKKVEKNKDGSYTVLDNFDGTAYKFESLKLLQEMIAKAVAQNLFTQSEDNNTSFK